MIEKLDKLPMFTKGTKSGFVGLLVAALAIGGIAEARQIMVPVDSNGADSGRHRYRTRFMNPVDPDPLYDTQWRTFPDHPAAEAVTGSWGMEFGASYNYATSKILKNVDFGNDAPKMDTWGVDATGVYHLDKQNSLNLRFEYNKGMDEISTPDQREDLRLNVFMLMPGYRYTRVLSYSTSCYIGLNVGVTCSALRYRNTGVLESNLAHDSAWGAAYSVEAGLRYAFSDDVEMYIAYRFMGSTARPDLWNDTATYRGNTQRYHTVRCGISFAF